MLDLPEMRGGYKTSLLVTYVGLDSNSLKSTVYIFGGLNYICTLSSAGR